MKTISTFLFFLIVSTHYAQNNQYTIKDIKHAYNKIIKLLDQNRLKETSITSDCNGNGQHDTSVSFYSHDGKLVYIHYQNSEGHSNYDDHYYAWNTDLIFYYSEYASWIWDYECTPQDQGFTNEIWTYEENRIYFKNDKTAIKCLYKTYEEKSDNPPIEDQVKLSDILKNEEVQCSKDQIEQIIKTYHTILDLRNSNKDICYLYSK